MKTTTFIKSIIATLLIVSSTFTVKADEGMWLIHLMAQTNYEAMKAKGVELSAEEIYSETVPSLKDAIVARKISEKLHGKYDLQKRLDDHESPLRLRRHPEVE